MSHKIKVGDLSAVVKLEKDPLEEGTVNLKVDNKIVMVISADVAHNCVSGEVLDYNGNRSVLLSLDDGHVIHNVRKG